MTTETILTDDEIRALIQAHKDMPVESIDVVRAIEQAVLQSQEIQALRKDAEMLDWLEQQTNQSPTGTSFDYVRYVENGRVFEQGYRFMRRSFLGERKSTIREAISAAMEQQK